MSAHRTAKPGHQPPLMLWISPTPIAGLMPVIGIGGRARFPVPQVTSHVTVALIVAAVVGVCHSTPQSGGVPGPVVGA
jgi:hypothetical protein